VSQVRLFLIEERVNSGSNIPPLIKYFYAEQDRNEKEDQIRNQTGHVLELTPDNHGPFRVGGMMETGPEEASDTKAEEIGKTEEPRISEEIPGKQRADQARGDPGHADEQQLLRQAAGLDQVELLGFRKLGVRMVAHYFAGANCF
jgi:hypothetical protein